MRKPHSIKDLVRDLKKDLGFDRPPTKLGDADLVRQALQQARPDLVLFLKGVRRDQTTLILEFSHSAAAQECQMESGRLLIVIEKMAGGGIARALKCKGPG